MEGQRIVLLPFFKNNNIILCWDSNCCMFSEFTHKKVVESSGRLRNKINYNFFQVFKSTMRSSNEMILIITYEG